MICPCGCTARSMSVFQESVEKAIFMWNAMALKKSTQLRYQIHSSGHANGTPYWHWPCSSCLCSLQISVMQIAHLGIAPFDCWVSSCQNQYTHRCGCQLVPPAAFTHQSCQCRALGSSGFCNSCQGMICPCGCTARRMSVFQQSVEKAIFMWNAMAFFREHTAPLPNPFLQATPMGPLIGTGHVLNACAHFKYRLCKLHT